jgi:hypothetical protein
MIAGIQNTGDAAKDSTGVGCFHHVEVEPCRHHSADLRKAVSFKELQRMSNSFAAAGKLGSKCVPKRSLAGSSMNRIRGKTA